MQTFIVLGIIPGTNIVLGFDAWLVLFCLLLIVGTVIIANHIKEVNQLVKSAITRRPLPANQLHNRFQ
jgi:hypothetical protein